MKKNIVLFLFVFLFVSNILIFVLVEDNSKFNVLIISSLDKNFGVLGVDDISLIITPSVVSSIVEFDANTTTTNYSIYWSKVSPVVITDNHTYIDYNECNRTGGIARKMVIQGLENNTEYYCRLYDNTTFEWASVEYDFVTGSRFIVDWNDEFFDLFLVNSSSNVNIFQSVGVKNIGNPFENVSDVFGVQPNGYGYINVMNDSGTWYFWSVNYSDVDIMGFSTSVDGVHWDDTEDIGFSPDVARCYPCILKEDGVYFCLFKSATSPNRASIGSSNTANSTFTLLDNGNLTINSNYVDGNEAEVSCFFNDTFRNNLYWSSGQIHSNADLRYPGQFIGFNMVDWLYFDRHIRITIDACGGERLARNYSVRSYMFPVGIRSGVYVGIHHYYNYTFQQITPYLVVSRDGINFTAINNITPIVPLGANGEWDDSMILTNRMGIVSDDVNDFIYYNGWDDHHGSASRSSKTGRIEFRKNGLTFLNSSNGDGWLKTCVIPYNFVSNFTVNGFFDANNKLNISVVNPSTGTIISGFDFSDFDTITSNSTSITPTWGGNILSDKISGDFQLNFSFDGSDGKLFSYSLTESREPLNVFNYWFLCNNASYRGPFEVFDYYFICGDIVYRSPMNIFSYWFKGNNASIVPPFSVLDTSSLIDNPWDTVFSPFTDILGSAFWLIIIGVIALALYVKTRTLSISSIWIIVSCVLLGSGNIFADASGMALVFYLFAVLGLVGLIVSMYTMRK